MYSGNADEMIQKICGQYLSSQQFKSDEPGRFQEIVDWFEKLYVLQVNENRDICGMYSVQENVVTLVESIGNNDNEISRREIDNFYAAMKHIQEEAKNGDTQDYGLLAIETFFHETHQKIIPGERGGVFSTEERRAYNGDKLVREYKRYYKVEDAENDVQVVLDRYNVRVNKIRDKLSPQDSTTSEHQIYSAVLDLFKAASCLLSEFLDWHPYADGNGKLARLLTSYSLSLIAPFQTPVYGLFSSTTRSEYLDALKEAQTASSDKNSLLQLLIKSSYDSWEMFTKVAGMSKNGEDWKKPLVRIAQKAVNERVLCASTAPLGGTLDTTTDQPSKMANE